MNTLSFLRRAVAKPKILILLCLAVGSNAKLHSQDLASTSIQKEAGVELPDSPSSVVTQSKAGEPGDESPKQQPQAGLGANSYHPFSVRAKSYLYDMFGPGAFVTAGIQSGVDQARSLKVSYPADGFIGNGNHPAHGDVPEWGEGFEGYSKRYADRYGQYILGTTIRYGVGEALHQDVTYHRCACTGVIPRLSHALISPLIAYTPSGKAVPSVPALVSPFLASEIAVKAWYPSRFNTSDALRTSATVYYTFPLRGLFNEFARR